VSRLDHGADIVHHPIADTRVLPVSGSISTSQTWPTEHRMDARHLERRARVDADKSAWACGERTIAAWS
jgi:hypothetical protein